MLLLVLFASASTLGLCALLVFGMQTCGDGERQRLLQSGEAATARILSVTDTGSRYNHHPVVDFTLEVRRDGRRPYHTTVTQTVPVSRIPQYQPGAMLRVRVDPESPSDVAIAGFVRVANEPPPTETEPSPTAAGESRPAAAAEQQAEQFVSPDELVWTPGPPTLPPGAEFAILEGHPDKSGPITMRLRLPAGYEIPAHSHPGPQRSTVLTGAFNMGTADEFDRAGATKLAEGAMAIIPGGLGHFGWAETDVVIQVQTRGPLQITYADPADDPREQKAPAAQ